MANTTDVWPVQKFSWKDVEAKRGKTYRYRIRPVAGDPASLRPLTPIAGVELLAGPVTLSSACGSNVGTSDADDLLRYRLVFDFHHPSIATLQAAPQGFADLTGQAALPALDFFRSDILAETCDWRPSDPMDGTLQADPAGALDRLLQSAQAGSFPVYVFGRSFKDATPGVHDVHQNQGSGRPFLNDGTDDNDHNDVWQDGTVLVDRGADGWAAYFAAFQKQSDQTDDRGNPAP